MTEYEDLLSAGDTWTVTKFPVLVHHGINSANPSEIDLVQWLIPGRSDHCPWEMSQKVTRFVRVTE